MTFLYCVSLSPSHTDGRREGTPPKQVSRSPNCSPPRKNYQRQREQTSDSSPRHALKPPNGVLAKMNRDREQDMDGVTHAPVPTVRINKQGLLNGDSVDLTNREITEEECVDSPDVHLNQAKEEVEEEETKVPEQSDIVRMNSIPEQKVSWRFYVRDDFLRDSLLNIGNIGMG